MFICASWDVCGTLSDVWIIFFFQVHFTINKNCGWCVCVCEFVYYWCLPIGHQYQHPKYSSTNFYYYQVPGIMCWLCRGQQCPSPGSMFWFLQQTDFVPCQQFCSQLSLSVCIQCALRVTYHPLLVHVHYWKWVHQVSTKNNPGWPSFEGDLVRQARTGNSIFMSP